MKKLLIGLGLAVTVALPACSKNVTVTDEPMKALELFTEGQTCTYRWPGQTETYTAHENDLRVMANTDAILHGEFLSPLFTCTD